MIPRLTTERLVLRAPALDDAAAVAAGLNDFEVVRWLTPLPYPYGLADALAWLRRLEAPRPDRAVFALELAGKGLIGVVSIVDELGYWLARPYWGQGYGIEAVRALLAWHFGSTSATEVPSGAHQDNVRSLGLLAKLGFVVTGTSWRFVQSQQREVEHIEMRLTRTAFETANGGRA